MKAGRISLVLAAVAISALVIRAVLERKTASELSQNQTESNTSATSRVQQPRAAAITKSNSVAPFSWSTNSFTQNATTNNSAARTVDEPLQDPFARIALAFVGEDPDAEDYWFAAINDLSLPANERQDLIEDLNEEGLSDPEHPSLDDLPLIFNRLALIETIGPDAADEVNAAAFDEVYKDLLNLAALAMGGGQAVR